jgi:hypothetical protein
MGLGYYRSGEDSVAWHGDYVARAIPKVKQAAPRVAIMFRPVWQE